MDKDDESKDCSWVQRGMLTTEEATLYGTDHQIKMLKKSKHDPCALVRDQAVAWNALTLRYESDNRIVFGDVVVSDWDEIVRSSKGSFVPRHHQQDLSLLDDVNGAEADLDLTENDGAASNPNIDITDFAQEIVYAVMQGFGCSIRAYNAAEIADFQGTHLHCVDTLEMVPTYEPMG